MDNLAAHQHKMVKERSSSKRRVTLHFTPTYSSGLNPIEMGFNRLTGAVLRGAIRAYKQQLVKQIMEYIKHDYKERAKPFQRAYNERDKK